MASVSPRLGPRVSKSSSLVGFSGGSKQIRGRIKYNRGVGLKISKDSHMAQELSCLVDSKRPGFETRSVRKF